MTDLRKIRAWAKAPVPGQTPRPGNRQGRKPSLSSSPLNALAKDEEVAAALRFLKLARSAQQGLADKLMQPNFAKIYAFLGSMFDPVG